MKFIYAEIGFEQAEWQDTTSQDVLLGKGVICPFHLFGFAQNILRRMD